MERRHYNALDTHEGAGGVPVPQQLIGALRVVELREEKEAVSAEARHEFNWHDGRTGLLIWGHLGQCRPVGGKARPMAGGPA